jgi:glutamine synthetase
MTAIDAGLNHGLAPAAAATVGSDDADAVAKIAAAIDSGELREVEVMWVDHQGHARGKRINASSFLERARGAGFAFCNAALAWDVAGDVKTGLRHADWDSGFPDFFAVPDLHSFRTLPWREGAGHVIGDLVDHHGVLVAASPRAVLRRAVERLAALGYEARIGVEIEFHLLAPDGTPLSDGVQAYSLQVLNQGLRVDRGPRPGPVGGHVGGCHQTVRRYRSRSQSVTVPTNVPRRARRGGAG